MDEKGFLFTTDAVLALVVVFVLTASIVTYGLLPIYQGQNHQHLEALADSALETMEQDGTLRNAAVDYANNNTTGAQTLLTNELNNIIPTSVGYRLRMDPYGSVSNNNGVLTSNDVATKVKVISGPQQGWMGRAYYKQDEVQFQDITGTQVTTVWNFHNYLTNFSPWNGYGGLQSYNYWASAQNTNTAKTISFAIPSGPVYSAKFLLGAAAGSGGLTNIYSANMVLNGVNNYNVPSANFTYLYNSGGVGYVYNNLTNINPSNLNYGSTLNNFYLHFSSVTSSQMTMPWFSIIASYANTLHVPKGIANNTTAFPDIAGIGSTNYILTYNPNTGSVSQIPNNGKTFDWNTINSQDFDTSTPFVLQNIPQINGGYSGTGSAAATVEHVYVPPNNKLFDAYTVVNAFGGEDGVVVQVKNATGVWNTIFTSWNSNSNTNRTDGGYGNVPGILNVQPYLSSGDNTIRIITWDDANNNDFDLVGLASCYTTITYSKFPIRWDTFPFVSAQNSTTSKTTNTQETQTQPFRIDTEAQSAVLFVGVGLDTRSIAVTAKNSSGNSATIYSGSVPYSIDLGSLDASHILTFTNGTVKPGNYTLTVSVTPSAAYESGDGGGSPPNYGYSADPEIFSGTRVSVIYPKFLENVWAVGYANDATTAQANAVANLEQTLSDAGYSYDPSLIRNNSLSTGDVPNAIPTRLDLWEQ